MRSDRAEEDEELVKMFVDEANLLARLHHPAIVRTIEVGVDNGQRFIAMELLLGMTLATIWETCALRGLRLEPDLIAWIGARIGEGLQHAHELRDDAGVPAALIHRDVNPANVFVTFDGAIKLFDFGMAKTMMRTSAKTAPGVVKGKLSHLAPEQIMQVPLDHRADVLGLGTTLWELCTMKRLFQRDPTSRRCVRRARGRDPRRANDRPRGAGTARGDRAALARAEPRSSLSDRGRPREGSRRDRRPARRGRARTTLVDAGQPFSRGTEEATRMAEARDGAALTETLSAKDSGGSRAARRPRVRPPAP
jgi:serine/threonine protein kinase